MDSAKKIALRIVYIFCIIFLLFQNKSYRNFIIMMKDEIVYQKVLLVWSCNTIARTLNFQITGFNFHNIYILAFILNVLCSMYKFSNSYLSGEECISVVKGISVLVFTYLYWLTFFWGNGSVSHTLVNFWWPATISTLTTTNRFHCFPFIN